MEVYVPLALTHLRAGSALWMRSLRACRAHLNLPCAASECALEVGELGALAIFASLPITQNSVFAHTHVAISERAPVPAIAPSTYAQLRLWHDVLGRLCPLPSRILLPPVDTTNKEPLSGRMAVSL